MSKIKITLSLLTLLAAGGGVFHVFHVSPETYPGLVPIVLGEEHDVSTVDTRDIAPSAMTSQSAIAIAPEASVSTQRSSSQAPLSSLSLPEPWSLIQWQRLEEKNEVKFTNGDFVIHGNGTLHLGTASVTSSTIASKAIESSHLDTAAVNSRIIEDGTIQGEDISQDASLTVSSLTVTGTTTFAGNQIASGNLDMQSNLITNIGATGTDFTTEGGLNLASTLAVNTDDLYVDTANGRVGIGTTAPSTELEVVGDIVSAGTKWEARDAAAANSWRDVTYGNGLFVAVAQSGTNNRVMTSPDGINWTTRTSAQNNSWNGVAYGNGLFVAVASSGTNRVMTSPDGITWTARSASVNTGWQSITYGNGLFVAVASANHTSTIMTSPDGITWTTQTSPVANQWLEVTYGNGFFVAVGLNGGSGDGSTSVITSPDGVTWTAQTTPAENTWIGLTYGNGLFVAVANTGTGDRVMTSPDGETWSLQTYPNDLSWLGVTYGGGLFVAVANSGSGQRVMTSPDGINWTARETPVNSSWIGVTYGNGMFVAVAQSGTGNRVMTSGKVRHIPLAHDNLYQGGMKINGNVGINMTDPSVALDVTGDIEYTGTLTDVSDERLKENIRIMSGESALSILSQLNAKSYTMVGSDKTEYGFLAQDVQKVFPDAVSVIDPEKGYLGLNYLSFIPLLSESVKELDSRFTVGTRQTDERLLTLDQKTSENLLTLASLESSFNASLAVMGKRVKALEEAQEATQETLSSLEELTQEQALFLEEQDSRGSLLESRLATFSEQLEVLSDFYLAFELGKVLLADEEGNVELIGELTSPAITTASLTISLGDEEAAMIGTAVLLKGESELLVETEAVGERSHIFLTPRIPFAGSVAVTETIEGEGFLVEIPKALEEDLPFDWWIVNEEN